ncbi:MAG: transporter substrate-binding domain-containing protein [Eubacterium sp.]|nr:transporter substrate-binding domain-containing protein [Eubacterium sp.]
MKKYGLFLLLVTVVIGSITACETKCKKNQIGTANEDVLVVAISADFPPYEYVENNEYKGIDVEIAKAIGDKMGVEVQIKDMKFDTILGAVKSGEADIGISGISITELRKKQVDFSQSYTTTVQTIVVKEDSVIREASDLFRFGKYRRVGVQTGTTGDLYCTDDIELEGLGRVERYNAGEDAIKALVAGKIDCVVIDQEPAREFVKRNQGLKILETAYAEEEYSVAIKKGNKRLTKNINQALEELKNEGTIQKIVDKYINEKKEED